MGCGASSGGKRTPAPSATASEPESHQPLTQEEVQARIQCSERSQTHRLGQTGITIRYAHVSQRGYYPEDLYKCNQDAIKVLPSFGGDDARFFAGVFDGHGAEGDACSHFVRDNVEERLKAAMQEEPADFERAYTEAFAEINERMHEQDFDDSMSGTTAITATFHDGEVSIANIGDSRAIIGQRQGKRLMAFSLSVDQTPYRRDERERVKASGAVVMSCDQLEGNAPFHEDWGINLGEEIDNGGDPPRVWAEGKSFPGCAFTRSIGDSFAEAIGVNAEPEVLCKQLTPADKFLVLASDGVWEFLTNQTVADMICNFDDPLEACRAVVAEAYRLWLQFEIRTDDITVFIAFIDFDASAAAACPAPRDDDSGSTPRTSADAITLGGSLVAAGENRPVRRGISKEKRREMAITTAAPDVIASDDDFAPPVAQKTEEESARIRAAVKANFLFAYLNEAQLRRVLDAMVRRDVAAGEVVIRQGDPGDYFYICESGDYSVTVSPGDNQPAVEVISYAAQGGSNPCFGELALMHNKPRSATVTCVSAGSLWAIDRRSFRAILMKSSSHQLTRTLRSVEVLRSLSLNQLQRLEELLTEASYSDGEYVIRQGERTDTFYVILEGSVAVTRSDDPSDAGAAEKELSTFSSGYFGERALIEKAPRAANVIARGPLRCLCVGRDGFEEVLGPLQSIIDADRRRRERISEQRLLQREAQGLASVRRGDFVMYALAGGECCELALATHAPSGGEYTLRGYSKARVQSAGMAERVMSEAALLAGIATASPFVPLALTHFQDESHLFTVFKVRAVSDLQTLLDAAGHSIRQELLALASSLTHSTDSPSIGQLDEDSARFCGAGALLGLLHLHNEGIIYRNLSPDALALDARGYLQLMDLRYAIRSDGGAAIDACGSAYFLAPEQLAQTGHGGLAGAAPPLPSIAPVRPSSSRSTIGAPVDLWALGILLFVLLTGGVPWIAPDEDVDAVTESQLYQRITAHRHGGVAAAAAYGFSSGFEALVNDLLHPSPAERLGCNPAVRDGVPSHEWFRAVDFDALSRGELEPPHLLRMWCVDMSASLAQRTPDAALFLEPPPESDASWCRNFGVVGDWAASSER